ncbi:hypothetical protein [Corynebacterium aquatimens]|uniref:Uncharacterized protein n=1 Tax=Corynebacterium aquatimens TaxID=1190508 RepID=A0A931E4P1_9CORY|nr:hypothetical protein [Corynebacterium aquatimens]MBG6122403.1 hypothetical protein [Corynebacterium aquatimens]
MAAVIAAVVTMAAGGLGTFAGIPVPHADAAITSTTNGTVSYTKDPDEDGSVRAVDLRLDDDEGSARVTFNDPAGEDRRSHVRHRCPNARGKQ